MYLVDTNVISEARKGKKANPGVQKFFQTTDANSLYLSAQTIGEIRRGLGCVDNHVSQMKAAARATKEAKLSPSL